MKKLLIALVAATLALSSCADMFRDELAELHGEIDSIKEQIKGMNTSLNDIQTIVNALQGNIYVKSIVPVMKNGEEVGYTITFTDNTIVTVYKGGSGGTVLGVKQDTDGYWYWTLNGEWLLNSEGKKVNASGVAGKTPQLKIEGGYWYVSTDDGKTWTKLGQATGDSMFKDIDTSNNAFVVLTLADGSKLTIPRYKPITISYSVESQRIGISANETISIDYTLSEGDDETIIAVATDGQYSATVKKKDNTHGIINITCPLQFAEGTVNVLVYDGKGYMTMSVLEFYEKDMSFSSGTQFSLDVDGGKLEIPYTTNFNFRFTTDEGTSWMTVKDEKTSETQGKIVVSVSKNSGNARTGHIYIYPTFGSNKAFATITINQASAYYKIDYSTFLADSKGGQFVSTITTSRGVKIVIPSNINWVTYSMSNSGNEYRVTFTVEANSMTSRRDAEIGVYATDGTGEKLGTIQIGQLPASADASKMMVFEVRANIANEYDVYLPLYGDLDCYIDWGDGTTDYYGEWCETVHHKYNASSATDYEVKVSGTVKQLSSHSIPDNKKYGIISVKQWGNTGLLSMESAFDGLWSLKQIPSDNAESFSNVTSFYRAFYQCDALRAIPDGLLKYGRKIEDLRYAFANCTAIQSIPDKLLDGCVSVNQIDYLFSSCAALESIPENLFKYLGEVVSAKGLFSYCESIKTVPAKLFSSFSKVKSYRETFRGCTAISSIPEKLFSYSPLVEDFGWLLRDCHKLSSIPENLFKENTNVRNFEYVFSATGLVAIPEKIFYYCPYVTSFNSAFGAPYAAGVLYGNDVLRTVPVSVFDNNLLVSDFDCCFSDCHVLEGESPYTIINGEKVHLYERYKYPDIFVRPRYYGGCFHNCSFTDRENAPDWYDW